MNTSELSNAFIIVSRFSKLTFLANDFASSLMFFLFKFFKYALISDTSFRFILSNTEIPSIIKVLKLSNSTSQLTELKSTFVVSTPIMSITSINKLA